jgi:hypothetical protein
MPILQIANFDLALSGGIALRLGASACFAKGELTEEDNYRIFHVYSKSCLKTTDKEGMSRSLSRNRGKSRPQGGDSGNTGS